MSEEMFQGLMETKPTIGSFSKCTARFDGSRDPQKVEEFTKAISLYKYMASISDQTALQELPLLLQDSAATWWNGIKTKVCSFDEALSLIKVYYTQRRPAYSVYLEFFKDHQDENTSTHQFVSRKRTLLAELAYEFPESTQIDMVYGLLKNKFRMKIPRESITTFEDLLHKAADLETPEITNSSVDKSKLKCTYCRKRNHVAADCLRRLKWTVKKSLKTNHQGQFLLG
ncbi:activity-regulated cytoskeleton associated protein 2-like [Ctenocephalides felis]|uniref:activity-regulated cytoskeleton associated protein 2-like n=1 Tax=Ctenocephalides felis TaxID=7515 RepID=UPI000E6E172D|nr:activity-regulated cytoskeleton associated protein 2-like [Ctenocephalides felis]